MPSWDESLELLLTGDPAAFDRFSTLVLQLLAAQRAYEVRDSWEDLAQTVLLVLITRPPCERSTGAILGYVRQVTRNSFLNEINRLHGRRRATSPASSRGGRGWRRNVSYQDDATELDLGARSRDLFEEGIPKALAQIDERERRAIEAKYFQGLANDEAAAFCRESVATYRRLIASGLASISRLLVPQPRTD